jgi:hypothetical protein
MVALRAALRAVWMVELLVEMTVALMADSTD